MGGAGVSVPPGLRRSQIDQLNRPLPRVGEGYSAHHRTVTKRAVLVQCDKCMVKGTGRAVSRRLVSCDLPTVFGHRAMFHKDCGGHLVAYDIEEMDR